MLYVIPVLTIVSNPDVTAANMFILTNNNLARASRYFVHFFAVVALLRHETSYFHEPGLWSR